MYPSIQDCEKNILPFWYKTERQNGNCLYGAFMTIANGQEKLRIIYEDYGDNNNDYNTWPKLQVPTVSSACKPCKRKSCHDMHIIMIK